jgi:hypothetical protein
MLHVFVLRVFSRWRLKIISTLSGFLLVFLWGNMLSAETAKDTDQAYQLSPITVMAPQQGVEINVDKTIINMDDFRKAGTVRNLTDVLKEIGAVDVQRINPLISSPGDEVSIRGLNEGRLVIEIDGRRINHTGHNGRYIVDWSTLNMDDIERIEIIRGGHSVLHPFAIGGVINLITKKGQKTEDPKPDFSISGGYGSFETSHLRASVDGGAGNFFGYHLSASSQETDGYLRNNFQENKNINGHFTFFLPSDATLKVGAKFRSTTHLAGIMIRIIRNFWELRISYGIFHLPCSFPETPNPTGIRRPITWMPFSRFPWDRAHSAFMDFKPKEKETPISTRVEILSKVSSMTAAGALLPNTGM